MSFQELELIDGVRFNWNLFPSTRLEASQLSTPLACLYTPLHERDLDYQPIPTTTGYPIQCNTCRNYVNPFIKIDRKNNMWWCPFCQKKSYLPDDYKLPESPQSVDEWPIELRQTSSTLEFELPDTITDAVSTQLPLAFFIVIDVYQHIEDTPDDPFRALKSSLVKFIERIPVGSLVGLITYSDTVRVHKIGKPDHVINLNDILRDTSANYKAIFDESTIVKCLKILGLESKPLDTDWKESPLIQEQILTELNPENKAVFLEKIRNVKPKLTDSYRPSRSSGLAHYVTTVLLSRASYKNYLGKTIFFTTGPCTSFPGVVLDLKQGQSMRSHTDILNFNAPHFVPSLRFYQCLGYIANGQSIERAFSISKSSSMKPNNFGLSPGAPSWNTDIFVGSLDQVGIYEMKHAANLSMGNIYLLDSFKSFKLEQCLGRAFNSFPTKVFNTLTIATSQDLKISKMIGDIGYPLPSSYGQSLKYYEQHHDKISDNLTKFDSPVAKKSFTNRWWFNLLTKNVTLAFQFDMNTKRSSSDLMANGTREAYIQFQLKYWDFVSKSWKLRISTIEKQTTLSVLVSRKSGSPQNTRIIKEHQLLKSFDQECWMIILSRLLISKIDSSLGYDRVDDLKDLLDSTFVRLLFYFGGVKLDLSSSNSHNPYLRLQQIYTMNEHFKLLPALIYHFRRNTQLFSIFNSSPDEIAYYHSSFLKMSCDLSLKVVQPQLFEISIESTKEVPLDSSSLSMCPEDLFLIMDTVFQIIVFKLQASLKLHLSNNDEFFTERTSEIALPMSFVNPILAKRDAVIPNLVLTQTNHSQSRFLVSRLNPNDKDDTQVQVEKNTKSSGFWDKFKQLTIAPPSYNVMKTDDLSLRQYYDGLVLLVKSYKIGDDE
ncbi:vWA-like protein [Suhomyces tanzawaensis NRRL Y-17324]|uniref:Protein transport protein SEC23 n=1 Tax=Suhomyces tanzawaensis NRRL Y-17324 TaxID=984487 RepID=A0A1E4SG91_9ASCO|nr:vWA-like protein [Suhomyces tanzawaensis NRRL Y-17324]ODV78496.1 vWA-like protein [Suhomyces tanzawaensis NRRL Y-17324]